MQHFKPERDDRASLQALLIALDASPRSLRRDECGDYAIKGKLGHVFGDGHGYLLYVHTEERDKEGKITTSPRRWTNIKRRLGFCNVSQDGDDEGCLRLDHLPAVIEAGAIREALGVRKRRYVSPAAMAQAISALEQSRAALNRPLAV